MPSGPVAELELRVEKKNLLFLLRCKIHRVQEQLGMTEGWVPRVSVGDTRFGSKHRIEAFGLLTSLVSCGAI